MSAPHSDPHEHQMIGTPYDWAPLQYPVDPHDEKYLNLGAGLYRDVAGPPDD
jgi:hypothetical protein